MAERRTGEHGQGEPNGVRADALASRYYGTDVSGLKDISTSPDSYLSTLTPGIRIKPARNLLQLDGDARRAFLRGLTFAAVIGYEQGGVRNTDVKAAIAKASEIGDDLVADGLVASAGEIREKSRDLTAQGRLSGLLTAALDAAIEVGTFFQGGGLGLKWGRTAQLGNPAVYAAFDYGDWTARNPGDEELSMSWWKGHITLVLLPDGSVSIDTGKGKDGDVANMFSALPQDLQVGGFGKIEEVNRDRVGSFEYRVNQPMGRGSGEVYPVVDVANVNGLIGRLAEEHDLTPTYLEEEQVPASETSEAATLLKPGILSSQDGKVSVSFTVDAGDMLYTENADGSRGDTLFPSKYRKADGDDASRYFTPTFVPTGDGKYLYVPQISSDLLDQGVKVGGLRFGLNIAGGINSSTGAPIRDPRYECTTDMWDAKNVQLLNQVTAKIQQHFSSSQV